VILLVAFEVQRSRARFMCRFSFETLRSFSSGRVCKGNFHEPRRNFVFISTMRFDTAPCNSPAAIVTLIGVILHSLTFAFCVILIIGMVGRGNPEVL